MYRNYCNLIFFLLGKVVQKAERKDNSYPILVIKNVSDSDLKNKSADKLLEIASLPDNGVIFCVDKKTYQNIEVGKKGEVTYSGPFQKLLPPKLGANK
ncbi:DUF3221 domain-containing protein [Bacillus sp. ISL-41]|uniref:DUF3221 domain-containing protein n=1 Tax=Bacillus sp. ISL-41 TaxID=2819127 RepID=UPI001BECB4D1|nr:DUF3221 domain-containing protein [Bacillus sp. ISL-41]MBT2641887.1 DUF3221 domain-containing protein [Bacillus sp. ISL-41]